jgi:hypothetical protein
MTCSLKRSAVLFLLSACLASACAPEASDLPDDVALATDELVGDACTTDPLVWDAGEEPRCAGAFQYHPNRSCEVDEQTGPEQCSRSWSNGHGIEDVTLRVRWGNTVDAQYSEQYCAQLAGTLNAAPGIDNPDSIGVVSRPAFLATCYQNSPAYTQYWTCSSSLATRWNPGDVPSSFRSTLYNNLTLTSQGPGTVSTWVFRNGRPVQIHTPVCLFRVRHRVPRQVCTRQSRRVRYEDDAARCNVDTTQWTYSAAGLRQDDVRTRTGKALVEANRARCVTCEHLPLPASDEQPDAAALVDAKFRCLTTPVGMTSAAEIGDRVTLLVEHFGHLLSDEQRRAALRYYRRRDTDQPSCGAPTPEAAAAPACNPEFAPLTEAAAYDAIPAPELAFCHRMGLAHVPAQAATRALPLCMEQLAALARHERSVLCEDGAHAEVHHVYRRQLLDAVSRLWQHQLSLLVDAPDGLGHLARQLHYLQRWSEEAEALAAVAPAQLDASALSRELNVLLDAFWRTFSRAGRDYESLRALALEPASTERQIRDAVGRLGDLHGATVRRVLSALFSPAGTIDGVPRAGLPLLGEPLRRLTSDALRVELERATDLAAVHDLACSFLACADRQAGASATPLYRMLWALASLGDSSELQRALSDTASMGELGVIFVQMRDYLAALGLRTAEGSGADQLRALAEAARMRIENYRRTGHFDGAAPRTLHDGMNQGNREQVADALRNIYQRFGEAQSAFDMHTLQLLRDLVISVDDEGARSQLLDTRLVHATRFDDLALRLGALIAAVESEDRAFDDLVAASEPIRSALRATSHVDTGRVHHVTLNGASQLGGPLTTPEPLRERSAFAVPAELAPGQMIFVELPAEARYVAACAVPRRFFGRDGGVVDAVVAPEVGPEGHRIDWQNGTYETYAKEDGWTDSLTFSAGANLQVCAGTPGIAEGIGGVEVKACVHAGIEVAATDFDTTTSATGRDRRATVALSSGLKVPTTPVPNAAVGALLLVLTTPDYSRIVDIYPVGRGLTQVPVGEAVRAHLIVNDTACDAARSSQFVASLRIVEPETAVAAPVVEAMGIVQQELRAQVPAFQERQALMPSELAALRSGAFLTLQQELGDALRVDELPSPLRHFFDAFLDKELVRLERAVEIAALERAMRLAMLELRTLDAELRANAGRSRMNALLARWNLERMQSASLRRRMGDLTTVARTYFVPMLEIWYPQTYAALTGRTPVAAQLDALLYMNLDASLGDRALAVREAMDGVVDAFLRAPLGRKLPGERAIVAVSLAGPNAASWESSPHRPLDEGRAANLWAAIDGAGRGNVQLYPEDLYSPSGLAYSGQLACSESTPVIHRMALYVVRPGAADNDARNLRRLWFPAAAGRAQVYAHEAGPQSYRLENDDFLSFMIPVIYGEPSDALQRFAASGSWARPVGISPFGRLTFDMRQLAHIRDRAGFDDAATEVVLVMELDSQGVSWMDWVETCGE